MPYNLVEFKCLKLDPLVTEQICLNPAILELCCKTFTLCICATVLNFQVSDESLREKLERIVGRDDSAFSGIDLATLIRNKYGRSYDLQLIKKVYSRAPVALLFQLQCSLTRT